MRTLRPLAVWLVALALLGASPLATLGECLACPPDCPMHVRRDAGAEEHEAHAGHAHHAAARDADGGPAAAHEEDCHRAARPAPEADGPCLSGVCGHMDRSLVRALPDAVLARPAALAPALVEVAAVSAPVLRAGRRLPEPPTQPPRALSA